MLVQLGQRSGSGDVVGLLQECHGRIRRFLVMARRLAVASDAPNPEIADTAAQIRRYFAEGFPLHVADEEIDIAPRLAGSIAPDLQRMHADHRIHAAAVAQLIALCAALEREPEAHPRIAAQLEPVANRLAAELESHMELEERTVFPALRALPSRDRDAILAAMRHRRSLVL